MKQRIEHDSMGEVAVPEEAYYGAQTQRAVTNFPVSGWTLRPALIHALGLVKLAAATANRDLGKFAGPGEMKLDEKQIEALLGAAREVAEGKFDDAFPIDVFQTGSGTSSNMNTNEVIANRAIEIAGGDRKVEDKAIHPNDHVNMGQSTNDMFPTAIHVALATEIKNGLLPALATLRSRLEEKATAWDGILKIGRTHLADATPLRLGQEIGGFARQIALSEDRAKRALEAVLELPVGGTAVGTGINTHPEFGARVAKFLADDTKIAFREATNHFEANAQRDGLVEAHALLRTIAVSLFTVANNVRWLSSGPRTAFYEVKLADLQPGSSIMPGKVNPVTCESVMQVATRVVGNDATIVMAGATGGQFQLHALMPIMGQTVLESVALLTRAASTFEEFAIRDMEPNEEACRASIEKSLSMVTSLAPKIGYEKAAALAHDAFESGKTIRELAKERQVLPDQELEAALDPMRMTKASE